MRVVSTVSSLTELVQTNEFPSSPGWLLSPACHQAEIYFTFYTQQIGLDPTRGPGPLNLGQKTFPDISQCQLVLALHGPAGLELLGTNLNCRVQIDVGGGRVVTQDTGQLLALAVL